MKAAARLAGLDANGARLALPIASPTRWPILVLEGRPIASQADRPHGEAGHADTARRIGAPLLSAGTEHGAVLAPIEPSGASDLGPGRRTRRKGATALQIARFFLRAVAVEDVSHEFGISVGQC